MVTKNAFEALAVESTQQQMKAIQEEIKDLNDTLVCMLSAVLEKMPRVTGNDQAAVAIESGSVGIAANQTLQTLQTLGGQEALSVARAQMIPFHLYNQIVVA